MSLDDFLEYMKLNHTGENPLLRIFMSDKEIRLAERLVKKGLLMKGTSIESRRNKVYYINA
jgi:hypothetical protein